MEATIDRRPVHEKYQSALELREEGEDAALYLATVCSMLDLATMVKAPEYFDQELVAEAKRDQSTLARSGKQIRIM